MSEQSNIKEKIKEEYIKCAQDPVYFMKKYYMIQHPQRGRQLFDLYPFQEKVLRLFQKYPDSIINKSRQLGISTLVSAYSLWLMLFNKDKNVLVIATKQDTAKNMVTKVRFAYDNLPVWLKIGANATENNRLSLRLTNGSQIKAVSAAGDSGRSEAVSLLIIDEAAFIDNIETIYDNMSELFHHFHAIITPATTGEAPKGLAYTGSPEFCTIWTYLGMPSISLPILEGSNKMPIGVQVVGEKFDDVRFLRSANWLLKKLNK